MKYFFILAIALFFVGGIITVNAQDLIILRNGNIIEAKVMEISPMEIRYKRINNLDGPMIVIPSDSVLSIRYENGTLEMINEAVTGGIGSTSSGTVGSTSVQQSGLTTPLLMILNALPAVPVAGNNLKFEFNGHTWTSKVNGENFSAGTIEFEVTGDGGILTLKQTHIWPGAVGRTAGRIANVIPGGSAVGGVLNTAGSVAGLAGAVEAPGSEIILAYNAGPPASLSLVAFNNNTAEESTAQTGGAQDESGQGDKLVSLKFSLGLVLGGFGFEATDHYYSSNSDNSYSASYFNLITPAFSLRLIFSPVNRLHLGIGFDVALTLVKIQIASNNSGGYDGIVGTLASYAIIGYSNIYLHAGYDFALGALYLAPSWAVNDHLLIGFPISLGSNQNFGIVNSFDAPDRLLGINHVSKTFQVGLSIQYVF